MAILLILAIGAVAYWSWRTSLRKWPYAPCRACGGKSRSPGSSLARFGRCPKCKGTGRQLRLGAREQKYKLAPARVRRCPGMTSKGAERLTEWGTAEHVPAAELARRQGIRPIESVGDLARPGAFESELAEFLAGLYYAPRQTGLA